jgi:mevalonate kinase
MNSASAPGKIILFGEHAVVYGRPALAVPVAEVRATATVTELPEESVKVRIRRSTIRAAAWQENIHLEAPEIGLASTLCELESKEDPHPLAFAVTTLLDALEVETLPPLSIRIDSTIPVAAGLGSGAAVTVAILRALLAFLGRSLPNRRISALAYEVERLHHGTPSGIDNTVITFEQLVYFIKDHLIEPFHASQPFTIVIGDTGIAAPTKQSVADVRRLWESDKTRWNKVFDLVGKIAQDARRTLSDGDPLELGPLMDENHAILQQLTISNPALDRLVVKARRAGALGAKLSGGGRGGNMIALVRKENASKVAEALQSGGAKRTIITEVNS